MGKENCKNILQYSTHCIILFKTTQLKLLYIAHGIAHENRCDKLARLIQAKAKISLPGDREKDAGRRGERSEQGKNERVSTLIQERFNADQANMTKCQQHSSLEVGT